MDNVRRAAVAAIGALSVGQGAIAQDADERLGFDVYEMGLIESIKITLSDQVSDGCMPRPSAIEEAAELRFRAAGIPRNNDDAPLHELSIFAAGYATNDFNCAVTVSMDLHTVASVNEGRQPNWVFPLARVQIGGGRLRLIAGPKTDMQTLVRDSVVEMSDSIALDILRARDTVAVEAARHMQQAE